jgi:hypothetical protein
VDLLRRLRIRRAAKRYARQLGSQLQRGYGASEFYTSAQIRTSVAKLGLNPQFIALGYASFLNEEEFATLTAAMPIYIPYGEAREIFERYMPSNMRSASGNPEGSLNIVQAGYSDHSGWP